MISKKTNNFSELDFQKGEVILMDKQVGESSFRAVHIVRKAIGVKKVGHAGTLDPNATGLLIICTGKKTKEITSFQDLGKVYEGVIKLGVKTPSMDPETEPSEIKEYGHITESDIEETRKEFLGEINQIPPMFSAIKHKGKALYKYARKGVDIERPARKVKIYDFKITKIDLPDVHFEIHCSKGTYIRVIANDFGDKLGCGGMLNVLRRSKIGDYSAEDAFTTNEFYEKFKDWKN